ncbi:MAG: YtxH domain-containing protein [Chitinophagaceae bacterium]|jgi:IS4 transposase|nr:YtxH domain-containing protein [Chitinophagaceae bacterium]
MFGNNKGKFLLAGLAAFAWYKYSKMSAEEKSRITHDLKEKGKKVYDQYVPREVKDMIGKKNSSNQAYSENTGY